MEEWCIHAGSLFSGECEEKGELLHCLVWMGSLNIQRHYAVVVDFVWLPQTKISCLKLLSWRCIGLFLKKNIKNTNDYSLM
jgi:hypothetical protein